MTEDEMAGGITGSMDMSLSMGSPASGCLPPSHLPEPLIMVLMYIPLITNDADGIFGCL